MRKKALIAFLTPLLIPAMAGVGLFFFTGCGKSAPQKPAKPHILLITIDTLRRDHLGTYGYPRETSPFIDGLARQGTVFKHVVTPIPSTASSHASILTSLHPLTHGVSSNASPLTEKVRTIAEVLQSNGYHTIGAISAKFLSAKYNFSQGFDAFSDEWKEKPKLDSTFHRVAESVNQDVYRMLDDYLASPAHQNKPLFMWVHYYDPHFPYRNIKDITFKTQLKDHPYWKEILRYDKEIRYTDQHIEKLHHYLAEKNIAPDLITCITADHGEEFGEHGNATGHADFYSEDTLVPLVLHGKGIPQNRTVDHFVSTLDIPVTLLGLANLTFGVQTEGLNLLDPEIKDHTYKERKFLVIGNAKYTRSLQLLGYPFSYILNVDHHYQNWYISQKPHQNLTNNNLTPKGFKKINPKSIKTKKGVRVVPLPYIMKEGLNYVMFRGSIKKNNGLSVEVKMQPYSFTGMVPLDTANNQFTILYPMAVRDRVLINLKPAPGTEVDLDSLEYAFIPGKNINPGELASGGWQKIKNKIHGKLATLRKTKTASELFHLPEDIPMKNDIFGTPRWQNIVAEYHRKIYIAFKYYINKNRKLLKGTMTKDDLTEEEKRMLKSLGYL